MSCYPPKGDLKILTGTLPKGRVIAQIKIGEHEDDAIGEWRSLLQNAPSWPQLDIQGCGLSRDIQNGGHRAEHYEPKRERKEGMQQPKARAGK